MLAAPAAAALSQQGQVAANKELLVNVVLATDFSLPAFKFPIYDLVARAMPDSSPSSFLGSNAYWEFIADQQSETVVPLLREQVSHLAQLASSQVGDVHSGITLA